MSDAYANLKGMALVVARIKFTDMDSYHCVNESGKSVLVTKQDLVTKLTKGKCLNAYLCHTSNSSQPYIRLAQKIPTIEVNMKHTDAKANAWLQNYIKSPTASANIHQAVTVASQKMKDEAPKQNAQASVKPKNKDTLGVSASRQSSSKFVCPPEIKKSLERFRKEHHDQCSEEALYSAQEYLIGEDVVLMLEAMTKNASNIFPQCLKVCYGTEDFRDYPDDLLCLIMWRYDRVMSYSRDNKFINADTGLRDALSKNEATLAFTPLLIWAFCGDWVGSQMVSHRYLEELLKWSSEPLRDNADFKLCYLSALKEDVPLWKRMVMEALIKIDSDWSKAGKKFVNIYKVVDGVWLGEDALVNHSEIMNGYKF